MPARPDGPVAVLVHGGTGARREEELRSCLAAVAAHTTHPEYTIEADRRGEPPDADGGIQRLYDAARSRGARYVISLRADTQPVRRGWLEDLVGRLAAGAAVVGAWDDGEAAWSGLAASVDFVTRHGLRFDGGVAEPTRVAAAAGLPVERLPRSNRNVLHPDVGTIYGDILYRHGRPAAPSPAAERIHELATRMLREHHTEYLRWLRGASTDPVIFVLGMHRSGTSCLTGCLEACGVTLGDVARRSVGQPLGTLEQRSVMLVNEAVLAEAGRSWRDPAPVRPGEHTHAEITALTNALQAAAPSAVKDPRFLFTLDPWIAEAGNPVLVGTFRHPDAVARSLWERDRMPDAAAHDLWRRYNARLVELHAELGFPLIEFDLADREAYCRTVASLTAELRLQPRLAGIRDTVQQLSTRTHVAADAPVPPSCAATYDYLRRHRYQGPPAAGSFASLLVEWGELVDLPAGPRRGRHLELWAWRLARRLPGPLRTAIQRPVSWAARRVRSSRGSKPTRR